MAEDKVKVLLRALEPSDIDLLYQWENDRKIWQVSNTLIPFSKYILKNYIENSYKDIFEIKQQRFIIDVETGPEKYRSVGTIDLFDFDPQNQRAGIGILIAKDHDREKGYATQALHELTKYAFEILHLNQLYCNIATDNKASIHLFRKAGFEMIGVKKKWNRSSEGYKDEALLQLINNKQW